MTGESGLVPRLQFLARVVRKECTHLALTDQRLFGVETTGSKFTLAHAKQLELDHDLAERVEAFVGRFSRLQDTLGDKLLPLLLSALGEKHSAMIDSLDRAERLGLLTSAEQWMTMRNLRNQMIHEYVEDPLILTNALQTGHAFVPSLLSAGTKMLAEIDKRGWT